MKKDIIFVPVRVNSKRLKNKLNLTLENFTIINHTIKRIELSKCFNKIILVTSQAKKFKYLKKNHIHIVQSPRSTSGTERIASIINKYSVKNVYILFGDEFLILPSEIKKFYDKTKQKLNNALVVNAVSDSSTEDIKDTSVVKCIIKNKKIFNFGRTIKKNNYRLVNSIGLFCIKKNILKKFKSLYSINARKHSIEQFKYLDNNINIDIVNLNHKYPSLNTKKDLIEAKKIFKVDIKQRIILNNYKKI